MKIETKFFDEIEIDENSIITFPKGLFAFEDEKRFLLIYDSEEGADNSFMFLQSVDNKNLCFIVIDSKYFGEKYKPDISDDAFKSIAVNNKKDEEKVVLLCIANIKEEIQQSTVNLLSPILINAEKNLAIQVILDTSSGDNYFYKTKQPIFENIAVALSKE